MRNIAEKMRFMQTQKLGTWLTKEDFSIMSYFLKNQKQRGLNGGILEIGTYKGGCIPVFASNLLRGDELVLWDIFELIPSNHDNLKEIKTSYSPVNVSEIVQIVDSLGITNQTKIIEDNSINLKKIGKKNYFKFIHIDGSHLYNIVKDDLEFALQNLNRQYGVIVVDDYRAQHCPGVAMAIWEMVLRRELRVLVLGPGKIYLCHPEAKWTVEEIGRTFAEMKLLVKVGTCVSVDYLFIESRKGNIYKRTFRYRLILKLVNWQTLVSISLREGNLEK